MDDENGCVKSPVVIGILRFQINEKSHTHDTYYGRRKKNNSLSNEQTTKRYGRKWHCFERAMSLAFSSVVVILLFNSTCRVSRNVLESKRNSEIKRMR